MRDETGIPRAAHCHRPFAFPKPQDFSWNHWESLRIKLTSIDQPDFIVGYTSSIKPATSYCHPIVNIIEVSASYQIRKVRSIVIRILQFQLAYHYLASKSGLP